jgi:hypothetical protein
MMHTHVLVLASHPDRGSLAIGLPRSVDHNLSAIFTHNSQLSLSSQPHQHTPSHGHGPSIRG